MTVRELFILFFFVPALIFAADEQPDRKASQEIHWLFSEMTNAWKAGDGKAWGAAFLPDADFTVWFGLQLHGQDAIAGGHQYIFDNFYANTVYELKVQKIRFLSPTIAIVHLTGSVVGPGEKPPQEPDSVPMCVVERSPAGWKIVAFQNTPFAVKQYNGNGDLRKFKGRQAAPPAK